jgi:hypothetical protein
MTTPRIVSIELREANAFIEAHHRHHKRVAGHRFSIGCAVGNRLVGIAVVGRPVARLTNHRTTVEVTRLATDGTKNVCSMLYSAAARAAKAIGYEKIQTFILEQELGTSLLASGWQYEGDTPGGQWKHTDGKPRRTDQPTCPKQRWSKILNSPYRNNSDDWLIGQ